MLRPDPATTFSPLSTNSAQGASSIYHALFHLTKTFLSFSTSDPHLTAISRLTLPSSMFLQAQRSSHSSVSVGCTYVCVALSFVLLATARASNPAARIFGGAIAPLFTSKHVASIQVTFKSGETSFCTGAVLSSNMIITAAHCLVSLSDKQPNPLRKVAVRVGSRSRTTSKQQFANRVHIHPRYRPLVTGFANDIAIISVRAVFPKGTLFVHLPPPKRGGNGGSQSANVNGGAGSGTKKTADLLPPGSPVLAAGFGILRRRAVDPSQNLQQVRLRATPYNRCRVTERNKNPNSLLFPTITRNRFVCATAPQFPKVGGRSICNGDSGGPLFRMERWPDGKRRFVLYGLTSFSTFQCGEKGGVDWFTNVKTYKGMVNKARKYRFQEWREVFYTIF